MIDRAAELALLGCVPMVFANSFGHHPRVIGPRVRAIMAYGAIVEDGWDIFRAPLTTDQYHPAEWANIPLYTIPQEMYDEFLEAIRP